jgi:hypothetical protein
MVAGSNPAGRAISLEILLSLGISNVPEFKMCSNQLHSRNLRTFYSIVTGVFIVKDSHHKRGAKKNFLNPESCPLVPVYLIFLGFLDEEVDQ